MKASTPTMNTLSSIAKVTAVTLALQLAGCSFKEDRKDVVVPIVDADPARTTPQQKKPQSQEVEKLYIYTVRPGDTLGTISQKYLGTSERYTELLQLNKMDQNDAIYVGQKLKLPTRGLTIPEEGNVVTTQTSSLNEQTKNTESENKKYNELESLLEKQHYNQAIQWTLGHEDLSTDPVLQDKLVTAAMAQSSQYQRQQQTADAETLLSGIINNAPISANHKNNLQRELSRLGAEDGLLAAKRYADQSEFDRSYGILLDSWQKVGKPLEENILFTTTRNKVSEHYHQKALRHYRNQELDQALGYWEKILDLNPNDDLALVYQDRVKALQNKLENL